MFKNDKGFFEDIAKAATGAVGAMSGIRTQIQKEIRSQINKFIVEMDFVPRDDFETVEAMAREARLQNKKLEARIAILEGKRGTTATKPVAAKKPPAKKTASAKTPARKKKA